MVGLVGIVALGRLLPGGDKARAAARRPGAAASGEAIAALGGTRARHGLWMRTALATGVVAIIVFKPELVASLVVLALAVALGFGASVATAGRARAHATPAPLRKEAGAPPEASGGDPTGE